MNAGTLNVLSAHAYTIAGLIGALGVFFALTSNLVKTIEGLRSLFMGKKNERDKEPTSEDVRDAGIPAFGERPKISQGIAIGAGVAFVGATVADAAFHAASHTHGAASTVINHVGSMTDQAVHSGIAGHVADHADSIWDVLSGFFEAILS